MRTHLLLAMALLAGSCETAGRVANPTVTDLASIKALHAAGNHAAVAKTSLRCSGGEAGCAQLRLLKADSCSRMATRNDPHRQAHLDCAIENYEVALTALAQRSDPAVDRRRLEVGLLDASLRRRDASTGSEAAAQNRQLRRRAETVQAGPNARPVGDYYAAEAMLNDALRRSPTGGCDEIAKSARLLTDADAGGTDFSGAASSLRTAIATSRTQRGCTL